MKKITNFFFLIVPVFLLMSCAATKTKTSTSKTMDIYGAGVIHKPVLVDLIVSETKVTGTSSLKEGASFESAKEEAVADALKNSNSDVLVEPVYVTETVGGSIAATVTGFPAVYKNFRQIKAEDLPLLETGVTQKAKVAEPATVVAPRRKKNVGLIILGSLALLVGVGAVAGLF